MKTASYGVKHPQEALVRDLALQQDPHGKYYYIYISFPGASQTQEEVSDPPDGSHVVNFVGIGDGSWNEEPSPIAWLAEQYAQPSSLMSLTLKLFSNTTSVHICA